MHTNSQLSPVEAVTRPEGDTSLGPSLGPSLGRSLGRLLKALPSRISAWGAARADRIGAELVWRELSKLSDAELHERGLTRATLARDVCGAVAQRKMR